MYNFQCMQIFNAQQNLGREISGQRFLNFSRSNWERKLYYPSQTNTLVKSCNIFLLSQIIHEIAATDERRHKIYEIVIFETANRSENERMPNGV